MLSTTLYSACTIMEIIMGSAMLNSSLPMGMTPILFSLRGLFSMFVPFFLKNIHIISTVL